ncbi:MAG: preprotein translocase subunit SecG [Phycisphaerales bacterium]|jgi:preprotein translocase subunit SecG
MILPFAIAYWATGLLVGGFLIVCVILMLVVLIQRPQGGGLSGAFGAGGSSGGAGQTAFGTKTGDALTFATIGMFILYLLFAVGLNFATRPENIEHAGVPSVTSTDPVETSGSGPLPTDENPAAPPTDTPADAPAGELPTGDEPTTDPIDVIDAAEQTATEIVDDAQSAADSATEPAVEPEAESVSPETDSTETPPGR